MVYAERATLRGSKQPIFINEDFTNTAASLFMRARKLVKEKKIFRAWTNQGCVYVKVKNEPSSKPKLVAAFSDLCDI